MHSLDLAIFPAVCDRIKQTAGVKTQKELAELLGLSPSGLGNYLRVAEGRGKITARTQLPLLAIATWAYEAGVSLDWVLTGEGPITLPRAGPELSPEEQTLLGDALEVLRAKDDPGGYSGLLAANIRGFKQAVESQQKLASPRPRKTATNAD